LIFCIRHLVDKTITR